MYKSRRARRRRTQALVGGAAVALALVIAIVAFSRSAAGGHEPSGCVILDVSESTDAARTRYPEEFRKFATEIADEGSGEICLVVAGADPIGEGAPIYTSVAPDRDNAGKPAGVEEVEANIESATDEVTRMAEEPEIRRRGSGLVEAAVLTADHLEPGDRLLYLSDGLQSSDAGGHLMREDLSPAGISQIIAKLQRRELMPDLEGVTVYYPLMLFHPKSDSGRVVQTNRVKAFWEQWAHSVGAELTTEPLK